MPHGLTATVVALAIFGTALAIAAAAPPAAVDGAEAYARHCAGCHGPTLGGPVGPNSGAPLRGAAFEAKWRPAPPGAFLAYISKTMPLNQPGGLDASTYLAIGNFIRAADHLPAESAAAPAQRTVEQQAAAAGELNTVDDFTATATRKRIAALGAKLSPVTEAMLRDPPAGDWLAWRRTQSTLGFSPLTAINRDNVGQLGLAWSLPLGSGSNAIAPLVHDGVLFVHSSNTVSAIDATNGDVIWSFDRPAVTQRVPMNQPRSIALYGRNLYVPTLDNHVLALDARTGKLVWDHQIGKDGDQIQLTAAPIAVRGKIVQPVAGCQGGVYPGGCFVVALDAASGKEVWRFNTLQRPAQPGTDTWNGAPIDKRFGGSVWTTPSYDAETNLIYVGTGQTYIPSTLLDRRPGLTGADDGLYTDSTIALDPDTGRLAWYYQHEPGDVWDLDWSFERSVIALPTATGPRKTVITAGKVGIIEALDAKTGQYLWSQDLGLQNLITAIDPKTGRKSYDPAQYPEIGKLKRICPSTLGERNWPATSYDAGSGLLLMPMTITCMDLGLAKGEADAMSPDAFGEFIQKRADVANIAGNYGRMIAIDLKTHKLAWTNLYRAGQSAAAVATAGGIVFEGGRDRWFRALDSTTGKQLWQTRLTASPSTFPITYAVDGRQYVAVIAGTGTPLDLFSKGYTPEIPQPVGSKTLMVFALPETAAQ